MMGSLGVPDSSIGPCKNSRMTVWRCVHLCERFCGNEEMASKIDMTFIIQTVVLRRALKILLGHHQAFVQDPGGVHAVHIDLGCRSRM